MTIKLQINVRIQITIKHIFGRPPLRQRDLFVTEVAMKVMESSYQPCLPAVVNCYCVTIDHTRSLISRRRENSTELQHILIREARTHGQTCGLYVQAELLAARPRAACNNSFMCILAWQDATHYPYRWLRCPQHRRHSPQVPVETQKPCQRQTNSPVAHDIHDGACGLSARCSQH